MDTKDWTLTDWKAHAYDVLAQIESLQRELQATNQKVTELSKTANTLSKEE